MFSRRSFVPMLAVALGAVLMAAQPAMAETYIDACSGYCGAYEIFDAMAPKRGANCLFEAASQDLDRITIRAPANVHGDYIQNTWVGWQYRILRNAPPIGDDAYSLYYRSNFQKDLANDAIPANGFTRRAFVLPENPTGFWKVRIFIRWYASGSQTQVEGQAIIEYDWYKHKWSGNVYIFEGYCKSDYMS